MTMGTSEVCGYCGGREARTRYDLGSHKIVKCTSCGLMRLSPMPTLESTAAVYAHRAYFENPEFYDVSQGNLYGYKDYIAERLNKLRVYRPIAEFLRDRHCGVPDKTRNRGARPRLLDVGCGLGYFLDVAQDVGFEVSGVEFNPEAVQLIHEKYAFEVHRGSIETASLPPNHYDVITMFDVIEHLHDPFTAVRKMYELVRPGGGVAISTMDSESFTSRLLGKWLEDFRRTREHLFFFSRETLTKILEDQGFQVYRIDSYGHTFELAFLLERLAIYCRPVFLSARWLVNKCGMGKWQVSVDPRTKMIVYAQKPR
jgi:2-polyprenyl-3-methyl-5-hydroxy-6-metoxy-1,4-benzoquinol methylase